MLDPVLIDKTQLLAARIHRSWFVSFLQRGSVVEVADLAQEGLAAVCEMLSVRGERSEAYALTVARRAMYRYLRRWVWGTERLRDTQAEPPRWAPEAEAAPLPAPSPCASAVAELREGVAIFERAAQTGVLTAGQTVVLRGRWFEDASFAQLERAHGWPRRGAQERYGRGVASLRRYLGEPAPAAEERASRRERLARYVAGGRTLTESARMVGISLRTARRWRNGAEGGAG